MDFGGYQEDIVAGEEKRCVSQVFLPRSWYLVSSSSSTTAGVLPTWTEEAGIDLTWNCHDGAAGKEKKGKETGGECRYLRGDNPTAALHTQNIPGVRFVKETLSHGLQGKAEGVVLALDERVAGLEETAGQETRHEGLLIDGLGAILQLGVVRG